MTIMPKHCLHNVPDHDCCLICLASVEYEDYFGGEYVSPHNFQCFLIFFLLFFFHFTFAFLCSVMQSQKFFFGLFIFHYM